MAEYDPLVTRHDMMGDVAAELVSAGLTEPQEIGRGGFGVVYRCVQVSLDRTVAVKVLTADLDQENLDRFIREQRAMGRLSGHPNIVNVLQIGTTASGRPFLVMQYHPHGTLDALIRKHGPLDWSRVLRSGVKLAGALETAHEAGVLHRDVKPANILYTEYGEPALTDFGIARVAGGFETRAGLVAGTPAFTAPEVLSGAIPSVASDLYGLGATLFCALTGHAAFERRSGESLIAQFVRLSSAPVPDLGKLDIPDALSQAVEQAMAADPADRPASAAEFGAELCEIGRRIGMGGEAMALRLDAAADALLTGAAPSTAVSGLRSTFSKFTVPPTPPAKLRPPRSPRAQVPRHRLIDALRTGKQRRLTVIHAPSGYGKSTLAAQWGEELAREGVPVAWLTVDDDDNNVVWFLAHLLESIQRARPGLATSLGQVLEEQGDKAGRYVLTTLIEELHDSDEQIALVIDDWQRVSDAETIATLGFLLENGCHHLHLIVTSWSLAGLPMSRLRILDELTVISADDLRFDVVEAKSLLDDVDGLRLSADDIEALTTSTEGWAAALQLAALSLHAGGDAASLVSQLSGANDVIGIGEFLGENVLDTLEPEMVEFLMATSITERTCGGLASTLAEVPRGQAMLEEVERRGLFLKRIPDNPTWFRFHHIAMEFLRRRLDRDRPERVEQLHRAASKWFAEHGDLNEAVDHALAAGEVTLAVDLVEQDRTTLIEQAKMATFLGIIAKLPPRLVVTRARLQLTIAWANMLLQRPVPFSAALKRFKAALDHENLSEAARADLRAEADALRGVAGVFADRTEGVDTLLVEVLSRPDTLHPRVAAVSGNAAAFAAIYRFDFDAAYRLLEWAGDYHQLVGPQSGVYARCFAGIAARYQADIPRARAYFREAFEIGAGLGPRSHVRLFAGALLGQLLYEADELPEATRLLDESYEFGSDGSGVDYLTARYVTSAKIKAAQGEHTAAIDRLAAGIKVADESGLPRLAAAINNERIRLGIAIAPQVADRLRLPRVIPSDDGIAMMTAELDEDSAIRLLSAGHSTDAHDQACRRADELLAGIDSTRRPLAALNAELLLVETLIATGRQHDAETRLTDLTARCTELGLSRLLIDAGLSR
ncbi:serine/threonine-protein kinase [[Mycobacterium] crassicus]|uniref:Serine/threonine-protein kinase PknK n=1 Tax=[Mycobacterium] crassicus TaxID=2872309 RepID=A0ABU5XM09_9MYCO|nr:serine/threonine-protein kinase [Mycolicibacter sp. MYC098]MEB3022136.1 protein kinase [Mycolicibacter sp. MYC098]